MQSDLSRKGRGGTLLLARPLLNHLKSFGHDLVPPDKCTLLL